MGTYPSKHAETATPIPPATVIKPWSIPMHECINFRICRCYTDVKGHFCGACNTSYRMKHKPIMPKPIVPKEIEDDWVEIEMEDVKEDEGAVEMEEDREVEGDEEMGEEKPRGRTERPGMPARVESPEMPSGDGMLKEEAKFVGRMFLGMASMAEPWQSGGTKGR